MLAKPDHYSSLTEFLEDSVEKDNKKCLLAVEVLSTVF